ncbi:MAG: hypothetical protein L3J28_09500 [Candidatus Polarisedimenticolaceae bacterium]|nr:hypothetical protein [Candidatus Polarisedimenticolaceae bacterium]
MHRSKTEQTGTQLEYMQHAEELLCHTSRYYAYTEQFLANLSGKANFSMTGYHCDQLSEEQRVLLSALMMASPTKQNGVTITQIVSDVICGRREVDKQLKVQFAERIPSHHFLLHHYFGGHGFQLSQINSPVGPIKNLARRLLIPIEIEKQQVRLSFNQLGKHLDSSNPTIRQNVLESIQRLYAGGYRLVNAPAHPMWHIDLSWNRLRISFQLLHWRIANGFHFSDTQQAVTNN